MRYELTFTAKMTAGTPSAGDDILRMVHMIKVTRANGRWEWGGGKGGLGYAVNC